MPTLSQGPMIVFGPAARISAACVLLITIIVGVGCAPSVGSLRAESLGDHPVTLTSRYRTACYAYRAGTETSFLLTDISDDDLLAGSVVNGQVLHVDLLWEPKPGSTPMDSSATNASIRFVILSGGEVGIYEGGGFALPSRPPRSGRVSLTIRDASIRLLESTPGFVDQLTPARIVGQFKAARDDERAHMIRLATSQIVTNSLGRSRLVLGPDPLPGPDDTGAH